MRFRAGGEQSEPSCEYIVNLQSVIRAGRAQLSEIQIFHKSDLFRPKWHNYLQYTRQVAILGDFVGLWQFFD